MSIDQTKVIEALYQLAAAKTILDDAEIAALFSVDLQSMMKAPDVFGPRCSVYRSKDTPPLCYLWVAFSPRHSSPDQYHGPLQEIRIGLSEGWFITPGTVSKRMGVDYEEDIRLVHVQDGSEAEGKFYGHAMPMTWGISFSLESLKVNGSLSLIGDNLISGSLVQSINITKW